jgi:hypothetical protein
MAPDESPANAGTTSASRLRNSKTATIRGKPHIPAREGTVGQKAMSTQKYYRKAFIEGGLLFNGKIIGVADTPRKASERIDAEGGYVSPGLVDVHCHGFRGRERRRHRRGGLLALSRALPSHALRRGCPREMPSLARFTAFLAKPRGDAVPPSPAFPARASWRARRRPVRSALKSTARKTREYILPRTGPCVRPCWAPCG